MRNSFSLYTDQLNGEYRRVFEQIQLYVSVGSVDMEVDTYEEKMMELLDIFLTSQKEGRPVEQIVGKDVERFCKVFYEGNGVRGVLFNLAELVKNLAWIWFVLSLLSMALALFGWMAGEPLTEEELAWNLPILPYVALTLGALVFSRILGIIVRKWMFRVKWLSLKTYTVTVILTGFILGLGVVIAIFDMQPDIQASSPVVCAVSGCLLALYYLLNRRRLKERKRDRISLFQMMKDEIEETEKDSENKYSLDKMLCSRYQKINKRRSRRGKKPLSWEEYFDKLDRETRWAEKLWIVNFCIPVVILALFAFLQTAHTELFDSWGDLAVFGVIFCAVYYPIQWFFHRIARYGNERRRMWMEERRNGIRLLDL